MEAPQPSVPIVFGLWSGLSLWLLGVLCWSAFADPGRFPLFLFPAVVLNIVVALAMVGRSVAVVHTKGVRPANPWSRWTPLEDITSFDTEHAPGIGKVIIKECNGSERLILTIVPWVFAPPDTIEDKTVAAEHELEQAVNARLGRRPGHT